MRIHSDRNFIEVTGDPAFERWAAEQFAYALELVADDRAASLEDRAQRMRFHARMEARRVIRLARKRAPIKMGEASRG